MFRTQSSELRTRNEKVAPDFVGIWVLAEFTEQGSESAKSGDDLNAEFRTQNAERKGQQWLVGAQVAVGVLRPRKLRTI